MFSTFLGLPGAAIDAGLAIYGGMQDRSSAEGINERNIAFQREFAEKNLAFMREAAQHGIRWRTEDAKAAGIHPLYAIGAPVFNPSPVSVSGSDVPVSGKHWASTLAESGQDITRAMRATMGEGERLEDRLLHAQIARTEADTAYILSKTARENSAQIGPPLPGPVSGLVETEPLKPIASDPGRPGKEAWKVTDFTYAENADGSLSLLPSKDWKDRGEDQWFPEVMWAWRNGLMPNWNPSAHYPDPTIYDPGPGKRWEWSYSRQAFVAVPQGTDRKWVYPVK